MQGKGMAEPSVTSIDGALEEEYSAPNAGKKGEKTVESSLEDTAEHILLEGDVVESGYEASPARPKTVSQRFELNNRGRGVNTELTLYEEGFLEIATENRGKQSGEHIFDLRYVDPTPTLNQFIAVKMLYTGLGLLGAALLSGILAYFQVFSAVTISLGIGFLTAALITGILFVYRTKEEAVFCTLSGRGEVIKLLASPGCIRQLRNLVPEIVKAINHAHSLNTLKKEQRLREEMREHYRLKDQGVLTEDDCSTCTLRILHDFD